MTTPNTDLDESLDSSSPSTPSGASCRTKMNQKPVFCVPCKTVINLQSKFREKLLCTGPTFTTGDRCVFSCGFCYVEGMKKSIYVHKLLENIRKENLTGRDIVIRRENPLIVARSNVTTKSGKFRAVVNKPHVIYSSPLVDCAGNMELVRETAEITNFILENTIWEVRLLSKSPLLVKVADLILPQFANRVIYGLSTGTLDDDLAESLETGAPRVSKRIRAIHELQDRGLRTFGMICPSMPQENYDIFAARMAKALRVDRMEHVWAEVINVRGAAFTNSINVLKASGQQAAAEKLAAVSGPGRRKAWEEYARNTFNAHAKVIPPHKLRFLQYVTKSTVSYWRSEIYRGAVVLGKASHS